jgi:hypothetical protein
MAPENSDGWPFDKRWVLETIQNNRERITVLEQNHVQTITKLNAIASKQDMLLEMNKAELERIGTANGKIWREIFLALISAISGIAIAAITGLLEFIKLGVR